MSVVEAQAAITAALESITTVIPELQVYGYRNPNPSPPSLDVYPGEPFQVGAGFGVEDKQVFFTVRARASLVDAEAGQKILLRLLDPTDPASVEAALYQAEAAEIGNDGGISGFRDDSDGLLSCEWRVSVFV